MYFGGSIHTTCKIELYKVPDLLKAFLSLQRPRPISAVNVCIPYYIFIISNETAPLCDLVGINYNVHESVTDSIIIRAAENLDGKKIIELLHRKYNIKEDVTEDLLINFAEHGTKSVFSCLSNISQISFEPLHI
jgi:hypothetical protein